MKEQKRLPLIALRGILVFPSQTASVDVGRAKSRAALDRAMKEKSFLLTVAQKNAAVESPKAEDLYEVGTLVKIKQVIKLPENNVRLVLQGVSRGRITEVTDGEEGFSASFEELIPFSADTITTEALLRRARDLLAELAAGSNKIGKDTVVQIAEIYDPNDFVDAVANCVVYRNEAKQKLLECADTEERLEEVCVVLMREIEIARVDRRVASRVQKQVDQNQKEFYLREQMKAISEELGDGSEEIQELETRVKKAKMPKEVREKAQREIKRLAKMGAMSPDAAVSRSYVETLADLPWGIQTKDSKNLTKAREVLEAEHFGLEKIKERILEYLAVMQLSGGLKAPILCFVGPPGVGKTSIVQSIAKALGRRYVRMSLGGVRDEAEIRGHRRTYVGAIPGKIIYHIKQAGVVNPVFLLDEIDKMASDSRGDPSSAMLEVLDPEQNFAFVDHYLEVPFDLSHVLFVATANTTDTIPPALLDRMEVIELSGYTEEEKLEIAQRFLLPKQKKANGLREEMLQVSTQALRAAITGYTRESGVRSLERTLAKLCRKAALQVLEQHAEQVVVTPQNLAEFLGAKKYSAEDVTLCDEVGSAVGLAWTAVGGVTLTIDVALFHGKGEILLTGQLGDVMKESARTAISCVRSRAAELGISPDVFENTDIHVHIPEGAIPKDGPSAGITMATAIASAFSGRKVHKTVAMTGEITLRGRVLPIGGLKEKALAAYRVGIKRVLLPAENQKDLEEIPAEIREQISFEPVSNVSEVFAKALEEK